MNEYRFDQWASRRVERYNNEPNWQRALGNFGFGFIFIGALANLAVFMFAITTVFGSDVLYHPWPTYLVLNAFAGVYWVVRGRRRPGT